MRRPPLFTRSTLKSTPSAPTSKAPPPQVPNRPYQTPAAYPQPSSAHDEPELLRDLGTERTLSCGICFDAFHTSTLAAYADWLAPSPIITLPCSRQHTYCADCLRAYLHTVLQANPAFAAPTGSNERLVVPCPGCMNANSGSNRRRRIWCMDDAMIEALLKSEEDLTRWRMWKIRQQANLMYCPNPACSELIELPSSNDINYGSASSGTRTTPFGRCPRCACAICIRCRVARHGDMTCEEYKVSKTAMTDPQLTKLMAQNKWARCPGCKILVERTSGCRHMRCLCRREFCYACGSDWDSLRGRCKRPVENGGPCGLYDYVEDYERARGVAAAPADGGEFGRLRRERERIVGGGLRWERDGERERACNRERERERERERARVREAERERERERDRARQLMPDRFERKHIYGAFGGMWGRGRVRNEFRW
ncbi:hypothetical protein DL93DRAFT_550841 [Clavulina sp. PMI_390]|nr:hypothetical protein DL93DRAFT_550841 [Clavulina sp. PMI_390]